MKKITTVFSIALIVICIVAIIRSGYSICPIALINISVINLMILYTKSPLEAANIFIFQWFFIRLTKCQSRVIDGFDLKGVSLMSNGAWSIDGTISEEIRSTWYSIQYWILPCTGWKWKFIFLNKEPKFTRVTKKRIVNE